MRSALAGIPLVSSSWMQACREQNNIILPAESHWIRSLPVRSNAREILAEASYGVAKIAARAARGHPHQCFHNTMVHLCGTFTRPPKADVQVLLKEGGATLALPNALRNLNSDSPSRRKTLVLICDDTCSDLPETLQRQVEVILDKTCSNALTTTTTSEPPGLMIVSPLWLFDSVAAGFALPGDHYPPSQKGPLRALWNRIHPSST